MFSSFKEGIDTVGEGILKISFPHRVNNHRPLALQSYGLFLFLVILIFSQVAANLLSKNDRLLGFATNISAGEVISLSNVERQSYGLKALASSPVLSSAATHKAGDMLKKDYWAHFAPDGTSPWYFFGLVGYKYSSAGENLARDFATSSGVVAAWMASPGHKANILNSTFTEMGVAVVNGNLQEEDTTLVVQLFGKPLTLAASTTPIESAGSPSKIAADLELIPKQKTVVSESAPTEVIDGGSQSGVPPDSQKTLSIVSMVQNASQSQKVTIFLLAMITLLMVVDSVVIFRKRHVRHSSHSLAHASVMVLLIISSIFYGWGNII